MPEQQLQQRVGYNPALDGLRALAALAVLIFHTRLPPLLGGFVGVDVFFVLSGFLITSLLRSEQNITGTIAYREFMVRRLVRLWPALLVVTLSTAIAAQFIWPDPRIFDEVFLPLLYISDYSKALFGTPVLMVHSWSLSTEMQFYLAWPLLMLLTRTLSDQRLSAVLFAAFLVATLWRFANIHLLADWTSTYYRADTRLSGLILGAWLATCPGFALRLKRWIGVVAFAALLALMLVMRFGVAASLSLGTMYVELAAVVLIAACLNPKDMFAALLATPALVTLGRWSYSLYLWHYPVTRLLRQSGLDNPVSMTLAVLAISIPLAGLTYHFVERPLIRLAKRRPRQTAPAAG